MSGKPSAEYTDNVASPEHIGLEILRHKIYAISLEMAAQLVNAAQLIEINEDRDFATAIVDRQGNVVAVDNPLQLGAVTNVAKDILNYFKFDMKDGDVVLSSDPGRGGTRVTDFTLLRPLFVDNAQLLYLVVRSRMPDIGGWLNGGLYPGAKEVLAEGVPFTPVKLYREGRPVRDITTSLLLNSRNPEGIKTALAAILASLDLGGKRVLQLISGYGIRQVTEALSYSQAYVERRVRAAVESWQDGVYDASEVLGNDGAGGGPVTIRVTATVDGDQLTLDFSASDEQRQAFINSTISTTIGAALVPLLSKLGEDIPANSGLLSAIQVVSAPGRVTSAVHKVPVGWSASHCAAEITNAAVNVLREAAGLTCGTMTAPATLLFGRPKADRGNRLDLAVWAISGGSANEGQDGWGRPGTASRSTLPSIEEWEAAKHIRMYALEYVSDTIGAGKWRGSPAVEAELALPEDYLFTLCWEGQHHGPAGTMGGWAGSATLLETVDAGGLRHDAPLFGSELSLQGKKLKIRASGGGGYGRAHERLPDAVLNDVLDGLISREIAVRDYLVALNETGCAVDAEATRKLRKNVE